MKKFFAFLLCFGLVCTMGAGLVGCGDSKKKDTPPAKDKDAKDKDKDKDKDKK